jgi:hypothetical protein
MNYDNNKYKIWDWKNPLLLFWMANPLVVPAELFFGIAIPRIRLIEREKTKPLYLRMIIPCPHCETMHNGLKWSHPNKTISKNWFGYYCDQCGKIMPAQYSIITLIILGATYPIWGWFKKSMKQRWLEKQPERYKNITLEEPQYPYSKKFWIKIGLILGIVFYLMNIIIHPLVDGEEIKPAMLIVGIPINLLAGIGCGYFMNYLMNRKYGQRPRTNNQ